MNRRHFLSLLPAGALTLRAQTPPKILIAGAGLAGLCSAYELSRQGFPVTVVEARNRPGGRVETLRAPFSGGLYAEAGAARIPDTHYLTLYYARQFGLPLEPFEQPGMHPVSYMNGQRVDPAKSDELSAKFYDPVVETLGQLPLAGKFPASLTTYDKVTLGKALAAKGATPEQIKLMLLGFDPAHGSAAWWLQEDMGLYRKSTLQRVVGGNDKIPYAFAERIKNNILYETFVRDVEQDEKGVRMMVEGKQGRRVLTGDRLIMALPFTMAKSVMKSAKLSAAKQQLMEQQAYDAVVKVFLQTSSRFWLKQKLSGFANTDLPIQRLWAGTVNPAVQKGLIHSYLMGQDALRLEKLNEKVQLEETLRYGSKVFPELATAYERGTAKAWHADPFQLGAFAQFNPGDMARQLPLNGKMEGRIHFAGEHTSNWTAWMQGALESAHRVVYEINSRL